MRRRRALAAVLGALLGGGWPRVSPGQPGAEARRAVEAFVARLAGVQITDLAVTQTLTLYHPDGRRPPVRGEERLFLKVPRRQRFERVVDGRTQVWLLVGDRVWTRRHDGRVVEASRGEHDRTHLLAPFPRRADDLLAAFEALGVREDVTHEARWRGRPVLVIGARAGEVSTPAVWFDPEYGVVRVITRERRDGGQATVDLALSEHRPLRGGVHFPYRQELFVDGRLARLVTVTSVEVNPGLADHLFDPAALRRAR